MKSRRMLVGVGASATICAIAAVTAMASPGLGRTRASTVSGTVVTCTVGRPTSVGSVNLGPLIDGLPLVSSANLCNPVAPGKPATVPFSLAVYGDCTPAPEEGCAPPLEIQTWPECRRNMASYSITDAAGNQQPYPHVQSALAATPAIPVATFDQGTRTEIYTGPSTIVVFAENPSVMQRAVQAIGALEASRAPAATASQLLSAANGGAAASQLLSAANGGAGC